MPSQQVPVLPLAHIAGTPPTRYPADNIRGSSLFDAFAELLIRIRRIRRTPQISVRLCIGGIAPMVISGS